MTEYSGRLCWDHDTQTHRAMQDGEPGNEVVTEDDGKTWRFRESGDATHAERYESPAGNPVVTATSDADPHHWVAQPDDPHFHPAAPNRTRLLSNDAAAVSTSHTAAWKDAE